MGYGLGRLKTFIVSVGRPYSVSNMFLFLQKRKTKASSKGQNCFYQPCYVKLNTLFLQKAEEIQDKSTQVN